MSDYGTSHNCYNAHVSGIRTVHPSLMVMRVVPDQQIPPFLPGQYATLGLGQWEPRVDGDRGGIHRPDCEQMGKQALIRRAYSVSCPILDELGRLVTCGDLGYFEFYIALVQLSDEERPRLTPRLFNLQPGSRLCLSPHIHGSYTLIKCDAQDTILFLATGTGEAPHNAMIAQLLQQGHQGMILSAVCVRRRTDLGYLAVHRELERRYSNYRYLTLTTREPENVDRSHPDYAGKQYLQDYIRNGQIEQALGEPLSPTKTHVYLCGNPDMIGLPVSGIGEDSAVGGMVQVLTNLGFALDHPHVPGNIHVEKYW